MAAKKGATARVLTAVEGEKPARIPDVPGDFLTDEGLANVATDLRRNAEYLVKVADGIDVMRGKPPGSIVAALAPVMSIDAQRQEKERAADKRAAEMKAAATAPTEFDAHIEQLQAEAQAAVYGNLAPSIAMSSEPWVCPLHGKVIVKTSSRTGRTFNGCPDCGLFERT